MIGGKTKEQLEHLAAGFAELSAAGAEIHAHQEDYDNIVRTFRLIK